ncbi:MAG: hypothetical protein WD492_09600 [Alkalispirochaeta sp.]
MKFTLLRENGEQETIALETGDIGRFALDYVQGESPQSAREIAFSYLNGREMDLETGDRVTVILDGLPQELTVSGIYQDVTNGGRTAKARLPYNREGVLWFSFAVDLDGYMEQTLGNTISRLRVVMVVAMLVGIGVSVLVTALFLQMLIRKDAPRISAIRSTPDSGAVRYLPGDRARA